MSKLDETKMNIRKIIPHLWFEDNAEEAAKFYTSIFKNSRIQDITHYGESAAEVSGRPKGTVMTVTFEIEGQQLLALNGGPIFKFSPAISFLVSCETQQEIEDIVVYGGVTFDSSLIKAGLIDKFHLFINPAAVGSGMAIFKDIHKIQKFTLLKSTPFDCGIIELLYEPMRN